MPVAKKVQRRIGFGFGFLLGLFFALIERGLVSWSINPAGALQAVDVLLLAIGMSGIGITAADVMLGKESLPAWFEGLVSGFVTVVGFSDLVAGVTQIH